ncbi:nuclear transport factor 2 family protein [Gordonia rubripertincta]|uniref:Nuclear transport factor 2 family protein n=1 Tax=Gordonia rubripertincta TaxID=36822 RepID=A0ABT4MZR4_GORRU|nr:nuclear transport factor 2 family protein [Gordonia rubripertincta]MCZ4551701.1 nuclear transport factor 2 family protein [Gordonia rubripertincta]
MSADNQSTSSGQSTGSGESVVLGLWAALSKRDWEGVKELVSDDCIYVDMPVGPTAAARGPEDIVKRLKIGLEPLADYVNHDGLLIESGEDVMYEHSETWTWPTGETAVLSFVTVHKVAGGKVTLWKDYWDFGGLASTAPPTWMEDLAASDMSWMYDATGQI